MARLSPTNVTRLAPQLLKRFDQVTFSRAGTNLIHDQEREHFIELAKRNTDRPTTTITVTAVETSVVVATVHATGDPIHTFEPPPSSTSSTAAPTDTAVPDMATITVTATSVQTVFLPPTSTQADLLSIRPLPSISSTVQTDLPVSGLASTGAPNVVATINTADAISPQAAPLPVNPAFLDDRGSIQHINSKQRTTIWAMSIMLAVSLVAWNMKVLCWCMYPIKMLVILLHELSHVIVGILFGAKVHSVCIDPERGGICGMTAGRPLLSLSAGYLGSAMIGSSLILTGFDLSASKVACLVLAPLWVVVFWFAASFSVKLRILAVVGLMIGFWFIDHTQPLRFYIIFLGMLNALYVIFDVVDDIVFLKQNESDAAMFSRLFPKVPVQGWAVIWVVISLGFVSLGILGGIYFYPQGTAEMMENSKAFMST